MFLKNEYGVKFYYILWHNKIFFIEDIRC